MYVGIDAGTTVTKAAAFDETGAVLATANRPTRLSTGPSGAVEQDMDEVLDSVAGVVRDVCAHTGAAPSFLGLTAQGDGLWLVDEAGRQVRPAVSWMDGRASDLVRAWIRDGTAERVFRRTGSMVFPGCSGALLAYLDETEPDRLDQATTAAYCKDVVAQRLTGIRATDPSDASLPFLDPHTRDYTGDVLAAYGLSHRNGLLAPVADTVPAGGLTPPGSSLLGLAAGTPLVSGPYDLPACATGAGVRAPGDGIVILGTTLACQVLTDRVDTSGEPTGITLAHDARGRWLRALPAMVGTAGVDWVLDTVGLDHGALEDVLASTEPEAGGVSVLPYFSGSGERAPFVEPAARAEITGLTLRTGKADLVRATCEAVAYAARHCLEAAGLTGDLAVCGGGAKSRQWLQIFADVLGRPLRVTPGPEVGARGAVLAGARRLGVDHDPAAWTAAEDVCVPDPYRMRRYDDAYAAYLDRVATARTRWRHG